MESKVLHVPETEHGFCEKLVKISILFIPQTSVECELGQAELCTGRIPKCLPGEAGVLVPGNQEHKHWRGHVPYAVREVF